MSRRLVTPPVGLPVLLAAAIGAAKADGAGMDAEIELDVRGIAGKVEHELQRALVEQTWRVALDAFPVGAIKLPMPPLLAVESVRFYDVAGNLQTLHPQDYFVDDSNEPGSVMPAPGRSWPTTALRKHAVQVQYRCGYSTDHTLVPAPIQSYILGKIAEKHAPGENRNAQFLDGLLDRYKVYG
ncbi:MAG: head-tail connector protein [Janthinobacterium lividum]